MKRLQTNEEDLVGKWVPGEKGLMADETARRIEWLTAGVLEQVAHSPRSGAWETLFRDPADGRFWERTYPGGDLHGGGPPRLTRIPEEQARSKYGLVGTVP